LYQAAPQPTDGEFVLRNQLTDALTEIQKLRREKDEALRAAEISLMKLNRANMQYAGELADANAVIESLRTQVSSCKSALAERDRAHARESDNLKRAVKEMETNIEMREKVCSNDGKYLRSCLNERLHETDNVVKQLDVKEAILARQTTELDRVYHDYTKATRQYDRAVHLMDSAEHEHQMAQHAARAHEKELRYLKKTCIEEICNETSGALQHYRERLTTAFIADLDLRRQKVEMSAVLGVVCDDAREAVAARELLRRQMNSLMTERDYHKTRATEILSEKDAYANTLNQRNDENRELDAAMQKKINEERELKDTLRRKTEFLDDIHFSLQPKRL